MFTFFIYFPLLTNVNFTIKYMCIHAKLISNSIYQLKTYLSSLCKIEPACPVNFKHCFYGVWRSPQKVNSTISARIIVLIESLKNNTALDLSKITQKWIFLTLHNGTKLLFFKIFTFIQVGDKFIFKQQLP